MLEQWLIVLWLMVYLQEQLALELAKLHKDLK
jgi:hypothetical protein